jgi:hypothetical protein
MARMSKVCSNSRVLRMEESRDCVMLLAKLEEKTNLTFSTTRLRFGRFWFVF